MATTSKAQLLTTVHDLLKKRYKPKADAHPGRLSVLEAVVYGICHEGMTRQDANQALSRFKDNYFDWNEVRVSSLVEIQSTLSGFPDSEERARRIRKFLRQMFQKTYGFNLDALAKKPLKDALKVLHEYEAFSSDFVTATVTQQALGGHAIPVDQNVRRALGRLGIAEQDVASLRSALERAVPKNRGVEFLDVMEDLAHDTCVPGIPDCPRCELRKICPYPPLHKNEIQAAAHAHAKPVSSKSALAREPAPAKQPKPKATEVAPPPPAKGPAPTAKAAAPPAKGPAPTVKAASPVPLPPAVKPAPTKSAKAHPEPPPAPVAPPKGKPGKPKA